ncbi:MAG: hypothetical protein NZ703_04340 [Gemmataceae bacterium]|nr:hypothetical protein [Gemmataceae bacterium]MCS7270292.1 hypothetical protein [Gemmataceae bacterium]MDW8243766.1 hypothetical protein [Thermogemmata sp.]
MTPKAADATQLTRQQLEELDALLQRMLALTQGSPLDSGDKSASATAAATELTANPNVLQATDVTPTAGAQAHNTGADLRTTVHIQSDTGTNGSSIPPPDKAVTAVAAGSTIHSTIFEHTPLVAPSPRENADLPLAQEVEETSDHNGYDVPLLLRPLAWITSVYNRLFHHLGWLGRVMQTQLIKYLLGIVGLLLLCYTVLWYLQSQSLINVPFAIPWTADDWYNIMIQLLPQYGVDGASNA